MIQDVSILCHLDTLLFGDGNDPTDTRSMILRKTEHVKNGVVYSKTNQMWITWYQFCDDNVATVLTFSANDSLVNYDVHYLLGSPLVRPYFPDNYGVVMRITTFVFSGM